MSHKLICDAANKTQIRRDLTVEEEQQRQTDAAKEVTEIEAHEKEKNDLRTEKERIAAKMGITYEELEEISKKV